MGATPAAGPARRPGPLLPGRVAVVTGGAGGIGRATAEAFAAHGARVVVADVDAGRTAEVVAAIAASGGEAVPVVVDLTAEGTAEEVVATADEAFGGADVLVNNLGHFLFTPGPFHERSPEEWAALHEVNLGHVMRVTHAALPGMVARGRGGSIITSSSVEAFRGIPHHAVYGALKAAVAHFSRCLALEVAADGIRVNDVAVDVTRSLQVPYHDLIPEEVRTEKVGTWIPVGRFGEPDDVAAVALFLASDLAAFVTGTTVHVDGGTHAAGGWYPTTHEERRWTNRPYDP